MGLKIKLSASALGVEHCQPLAYPTGGSARTRNRQLRAEPARCPKPVARPRRQVRLLQSRRQASPAKPRHHPRQLRPPPQHRR